jgi:hypothetical protein
VSISRPCGVVAPVHASCKERKACPGFSDGIEHIQKVTRGTRQAVETRRLQRVSLGKGFDGARQFAASGFRAACCLANPLGPGGAQMLNLCINYTKSQDDGSTLPQLLVQLSDVPSG